MHELDKKEYSKLYRQLTDDEKLKLRNFRSFCRRVRKVYEKKQIDAIGAYTRCAKEHEEVVFGPLPRSYSVTKHLLAAPIRKLATHVLYREIANPLGIKFS